jgi:hypothetical protein
MQNYGTIPMGSGLLFPFAGSFLVSGREQRVQPTTSKLLETVIA